MTAAVDRENGPLRDRWKAADFQDLHGKWVVPGWMDPNEARAVFCDEAKALRLGCRAGWYRDCYVHDRGFSIVHETLVRVRGEVVASWRVPAKLAPPPPKRSAPPPPPPKGPPPPKVAPLALKGPPPRKVGP